MDQSEGVSKVGQLDEASSSPSRCFSRSPTRPYFDPDLVVTRDANGKPVSRYGEPSWNCSSLSADGTSGANLLFSEVADTADLELFELSVLVREQHKALLWLYMDAGTIRAILTIKGANWTLLAWCKRALARRVSLFELLVDPEAVGGELTTMNLNYLALTSGLIKALCRHRAELRVPGVPLHQLVALIAVQIKERPEYLQTPLIPSRIYCAILGGLISGLDEVESDLDVLLDAYRQSMAASLAAPAGASPGQRTAFRAMALSSTIERMKAIGYSPERSTALDQFIVGRINLCQSKLMHTVAAFSGMRISEVCMLPLSGAIETFVERGSTHYEIKGFTKKLHKGIKKPASWITSVEGHRAIVLAQRIGSTLIDVLGGQPSDGQTALLFPSTENCFRRKANQSIVTYQSLLIDTICPLITQEDIDELNNLELDRGWQRDGIEVGKLWPLTFHQLRRSLSVYAHRSGMVSLPALKSQLQHITDELRAYYSDGFSRAVNLVFDKDHFSHEWNAAMAESSYFGYTLGLLFSDEDLLGRGAERMAAVVSTRSREETLRLFQQGKLAYEETPLGGCASLDECKVMPLQPIPFDCLATDCANQVVFHKRLDYVIRTQETVVATLERGELGSVEHRLEVGNLQVLLKARQKLGERAR